MDILMIGNGLNRVSDRDYSWGAVLGDLAPHAELPADFLATLSAKPFTLAFEEICFVAAAHAATRESDARVEDLELGLKRSVAENIRRIPANALHARAMAAAVAAAAEGPQHIITTNYDYNLERAAEDAQGLTFGPSETDETKYSLRRCRRAATEGSSEIAIWHVHGEADHPRTLMLSHDHYVRYINRMRRYVPADTGAADSGNGDEESGDESIRDALGREVWIPLFLQSDVHVLGFGFDYTEIELWWLLSLKRREALRGRAVGRTITYPAMPPESDYTKAREGILASYGVEVNARFHSKTYADGYARFLDWWWAR